MTDTDPPALSAEVRALCEEATVDADAVEGLVRITTTSDNISASTLHDVDDARELLAELEDAIAAVETDAAEPNAGAIRGP